MNGLELVDRRREYSGVVPEVVPIVGRRRAVWWLVADGAVTLASAALKPIVVHDERVDRELAVPESRHVAMDIVPPAPQPFESEGSEIC